MPPASPQPLFTTVEVKGFRSLVDARIDLGRLTVVIGANGSGKSNLLEAIALLGAASAGKGDQEFLASRGIRVAPAEQMVSVLAAYPAPADGTLRGSAQVHIRPAGHEQQFGTWMVARADKLWQRPGLSFPSGVQDHWHPRAIDPSALGTGAKFAETAQAAEEATNQGEPYGLSSFLIFSPEYRALRTFSDETQIRPVGIDGAGLFGHLWELAKRHPDVVRAIGEHLKVLDWCDGFDLPTDLGPGERRLTLRDRYVGGSVTLDQRSANEGFLFLLFAYTLLLSPDTPRFFAIDNADASLNPLVCAQLTRDIATLARQHDKQVLLTTHNAAMLDGLDLGQDDERLFVAERDLDGATTFRRIGQPGGAKVRLSEAFLRGYLGGLPRGF